MPGALTSVWDDENPISNHTGILQQPLSALRITHNASAFADTAILGSGIADQDSRFKHPVVDGDNAKPASFMIGSHETMGSPFDHLDNATTDANVCALPAPGNPDANEVAVSRVVSFVFGDVDVAGSIGDR